MIVPFRFLPTRTSYLTRFVPQALRSRPWLSSWATSARWSESGSATSVRRSKTPSAWWPRPAPAPPLRLHQPIRASTRPRPPSLPIAGRPWASMPLRCNTQSQSCSRLAHPWRHVICWLLNAFGNCVRCCDGRERWAGGRSCTYRRGRRVLFAPRRRVILPND